MSEAGQITVPPKDTAQFPALGGRLAAVFLSALMGPAIVGFILGCLGQISLLMSEPAQFGKGLGLILYMTFFAPLLGGPIALGIGLLGLLFCLRAQRIRLWWVLLMTGIGIVVSGAVLAMRPPFAASAMELLREVTRFSVIFMPPALMSAATCWRVTKSLHSPEGL